MHFSRDFDKIFEKILSKINIELNEEEIKILKYFIRNISVGEILTLLDLRRMGISDPEYYIRRLTEKGLLERGEGCYNLAKELREEVFKLRRELHLY